jgi:hypothetical protein
VLRYSCNERQGKRSSVAASRGALERCHRFRERSSLEISSLQTRWLDPCSMFRPAVPEACCVGASIDSGGEEARARFVDQEHR